MSNLSSTPTRSAVSLASSRTTLATSATTPTTKPVVKKVKAAGIANGTVEPIEMHQDYARMMDDFSMQSLELKASLDQVEKERGFFL